MKAHFFSLSIGLSLLISCSDDDQTATPETITTFTYRFDYMDVPGSSVAGGADNLMEVTSVNGKVTRIVGGFKSMDLALGYEFAFSRDLYREVSYEGNSATIISKTSFPGMTVFENKQVITFDQSGKPINRIRLSEIGSLNNDTVRYVYENNRLKHYEFHQNYLRAKSEVYYNAQANVDSIVTKFAEWMDGQYQFDPTIKRRTVVVFEEYDQTNNPFGNLILFEEAFYRSLSANNFRKFRKMQYGYNNEVEFNSFTEWNFVYQNGLINFSL